MVLLHQNPHVASTACTLARASDGTAGRAPIMFINSKTGQRWWPDPRQHMFISGYSRAGKTTALFHASRRLIKKGYGLAVIDLHGDYAEETLQVIPRKRRKDVVWLDASEGTVALNLCEYDPGNHQKIAHLVDAFRSIYTMDDYSALLLKYCLTVHSFHLRSDIRGILRMLRDPDYLQYLLQFCDDEEAYNFFTLDYPAWENLYRFRAEREAPLKIAIGDILSNPGLKRMFCNPRSKLNMREVMDRGQILLCSIPRGKLGDQTAGLAGALVLSLLRSAAFSRIDVPLEDRRLFHVILDECHLTASPEVITSCLAGTGAFGLYLTLAMQYAYQAEAVATAALANCQVKASWRPSGYAMEQEFAEFDFKDINERAHQWGYRNAVAVIDGNEEFAGLPLQKTLPNVAQRIKYATPDDVKAYSTRRYGKSK